MYVCTDNHTNNIMVYPCYSFRQLKIMYNIESFKGVQILYNDSIYHMLYILSIYIYII